MTDSFTQILPTLLESSSRGFNIFDVLHHGTHERQLSNLFAWLLDADGSHELGDRFLGWFLEEVNAELVAQGEQPVTQQPFAVEQERNTRGTAAGGDIADIVLVGQDCVLVVENFRFSDGHGHDYAGYQTFGRKTLDARSVVVMLCEYEDRTRLRDGWENAPVVRYANLIRRLSGYLDSDPTYAQDHPDQAAFFGQAKSHFLKEMDVNQSASLEFITVMCQTGEARRYGGRNADVAFAEFIRERAQRKFTEGQAVLNTIKWTLQSYLNEKLPALNDALGETYFEGTDIGLAGIYQWDVSLRRQGQRNVYVMFGPSAWTDNERDVYKSWDVKIAEPDYSHLFIGVSETRALHQSATTMADVLGDRFSEDTRLVDEIVRAVRAAGFPRADYDPGSG